MRPVPGCLLQPLQARRLELRDLLPHEPQPRHVAAQLGERVRRQRRALRRAQRLQALRRLAQGRLEAADAQAGQGALHPVHDPGALADQALPLAARALGVLLLEGRDRGHAAVVRLAAQPAQEGALEQLGVEPVGLGPPVLARDRDARRVDDVGLDAARPQPAGEPEAVAPGLEGDREAGDRAPGPGRLVPPALQQPEQRLLVRRRASSAGGARSRARCPATSQLDRLSSTTATSVLSCWKADEGPAQVIALRHGALHRLFPAPMVAHRRRPPHSVSTTVTPEKSATTSGWT